MIPSTLPELPWQKVATDLYEWEQSTYLLIVDYYSRYIEIARLNRATAAEVIAHTKSVFARHGIPEVVISDNGPQYTSDAYHQFAKDYTFQHLTSSPYFPQSNGEAERAVKTIKNLLKKKGDPYLALLAYRTTPLETGYSPAELLMSRIPRTNIPTTRKQRTPKVPDLSSFRAKDQKAKARQKQNFDDRHGARDLSPLNPGDTVWIPDRKAKAQVTEEVAERSFEVTTSDGTFRRNRRDLIALPELNSTNPNTNDPNTDDSTTHNSNTNESILSNIPPVRRSARATRAPNRLDPSWT